MKVFEFAWTWYEDYYPYLFGGDDSITPEQWGEDCKRALKAVGEEYLRSEECWASMDRWVEKAAEKLTEYGYTRIKPERFSIWGGFIIEKKDAELIEHIGNELFEEAVKFNTHKERKMESKYGQRN